jgi:hypothetical protein
MGCGRRRGLFPQDAFRLGNVDRFACDGCIENVWVEVRAVGPADSANVWVYTDSSKACFLLERLKHRGER